jgi:hypothetical protein
MLDQFIMTIELFQALIAFVGDKLPMLLIMTNEGIHSCKRLIAILTLECLTQVHLSETL